MAVKESGLYYPNKMGYIYIKNIEGTIGPEAVKAVYELADVPLDYYPPPNNLANEFDFAYFGSITAAIDQMYGRGGRALNMHAGKAAFSKGLAEYGSVLGIGELAFKAIPLTAKLRVGLRAMAETFSKFTDQLSTVDEADEYFIYTIHRCPVCWGRTSDRPICYSAIGILDEGLGWVSGGKKFHIEEVSCHAVGDEHCIFHIQKTPSD
jgi:predicted hydrocarbon binding protein